MTVLQYFVNCEVCLSVDPTRRRENLMLLDQIVQDKPGWLTSRQQLGRRVYRVGGLQDLTEYPPCRIPGHQIHYSPHLNRDEKMGHRLLVLASDDDGQMVIGGG
jgi:hypothetical protein